MKFEKCLFEKSKTVFFFFGSLIMKNICVLPPRSRFPIKLICCIAFASASSFCCLINLIKSIVISLKYYLK